MSPVGAPLLSFAVERHGAIVGGGSTRAEMQHRVVDARSRTAQIQGTGRRQIRPTASRIDVRPMVEEIAQLVAERTDDHRVTWSDDGHTFRVAIGKIIPDDGFKTDGHRSTKEVPDGTRFPHGRHGLGKNACSVPLHVASVSDSDADVERGTVIVACASSAPCRCPPKS
jgi:hypothetical protein